MAPDGLLVCYQCGLAHRHRGLHLARAHGMPAADYRVAHDLARSRGLVAEELRAVIADNARPGWTARRALSSWRREIQRTPRRPVWSRERRGPRRWSLHARRAPPPVHAHAPSSSSPASGAASSSAPSAGICAVASTAPDRARIPPPGEQGRHGSQGNARDRQRLRKAISPKRQRGDASAPCEKDWPDQKERWINSLRIALRRATG